MNKKKMLRIVALVVLLSLAFTSVVFAMPLGQWKMPPGQLKKLARNHDNYNTAADFMRTKGIIKGYGNGNFGFEDFVKRGDIIVMIVRAFKISTFIDELEDNFPDVEKGSYFYEAIAATRRLGIAKGNGVYFKPHQYVTIEEAILLIERSLNAAGDKIDLEDVDLRELFDEDELDDFATRQDIALMLYSVLKEIDFNEDDDDYEEPVIEDIEYTIDEDSEIKFDKNDFLDAFEDIEKETDSELDYVKFELPGSKYGKLYYDYESDDDYKSLVTESTKYYVDSDSDKEISDITFVPKLDFSGSLIIEYTAYDEENKSYPGTIKIIVEEDAEKLNTIEYTIEENTNLLFDKDDFIEVFEDTTQEDMNYVKFILPDEKSGKLYYDYDDDKISVTETRQYSIDRMDDITFVPYSDFTGEVEIEYIAYDEDGESYYGKIKIEVEEKEYEIEALVLNTDEDEDISFDFKDKLQDLTDDDIYDDFEYVMFELPDTDGKLYIKYNNETNKLVNKDKEYQLKYIERVTFSPEDTETVYINYTVYDDNDGAYDGLIKINIDEK